MKLFFITISFILFGCSTTKTTTINQPSEQTVSVSEEPEDCDKAQFWTSERALTLVRMKCIDDCVLFFLGKLPSTAPEPVCYTPLYDFCEVLTENFKQISIRDYNACLKKQDAKNE